MPSLGGWEWVILAVVALLLFGGSRLAGIGKNTGRAIREFKEETATLRTPQLGSEPSTPPASAVTSEPVATPDPAVVEAHPEDPKP